MWKERRQVFDKLLFRVLKESEISTADTSVVFRPSLAIKSFGNQFSSSLGGARLSLSPSPLHQMPTSLKSTFLVSCSTQHQPSWFLFCVEPPRCPDHSIPTAGWCTLYQYYSRDSSLQAALFYQVCNVLLRLIVSKLFPWRFCWEFLLISINFFCD